MIVFFSSIPSFIHGYIFRMNNLEIAILVYPFFRAFERYSVSFGLVSFLFFFFVKNEKLGLTNQLNLNLNGVEVYG